MASRPVGGSSQSRSRASGGPHRIEIAESGLSGDVYDGEYDTGRTGPEGRSARILDINPGLLFRGLSGVAVVPDLWGDEEGFEAWVPMQGPREEVQ